MEEELQHTSAVTPKDFTLSFLERITNKFSKDNIIGYGGYGVVYKGVLDDGEVIAVKKLYHKHPELDDDKQFRNECINLMRVQHENVVRLIGYCYEISHKVLPYDGQYVFSRVEERALCFEYLQGGSLHKHLSDETSGFGWHARYNIIKGICEGLHYLHNGSKDPIYHLDLKPANILLDKNMMPKIGDFGLSRLVDSTQTCTTKEIRGTYGYMPPEYINRYQITPKFDIFSLGVIIIQIMAGRQGYSRCGDMPSQEFIDLVHKNWMKTGQATMSSHTSHEVKMCIKIALRCVEVDKVNRPTISEIVDKLNKIDIAKKSLLNQVTNSRSKQEFNQYASSEVVSGAHGVTTADSMKKAFLAMEEGFITLVSRLWDTKPSLATVGTCCLVGVVCVPYCLAVLGKVGRDGQIIAEKLSSEHNVCDESVRKELMAQHPDDQHIVVLRSA